MNSPNNQKHISITRILKAPLEKAWQMWVRPEKFSQWYGPTGATIPTAEMDVSVGGSRFVGMEMQTPNGPMKMWFKGEFLEITPMTRLVYTEAMADENGTMLSAQDMGMPQVSPDSTTVVVELEEKDDTVTMTMTHQGVPAGSPGEQGWMMAFDKLEQLLATN